MLIVLSVASCDPEIDVHINGNCNGNNNCNDSGSENTDSGDSSDSTDSSGESESASESESESESGSESESESGSESESESGSESESESDSESETGEPGLEGCGNGSPFPGDVCFHPAVQYTVNLARSGGVADMDGDGHVDVVVTTATALTVYLGDGSGTLVPFSSVAALSQPSSVALGDVDDDGDVDVAISANSNARVRVHFNDGSGVLTDFDEYVTFAGPRGVVLEDLDEDGDLDLAYIQTSDKKVSVRKNDGVGNFGAQTAYDIEGASVPMELYAGDIDGDDALDLVSTSSNPAILYNFGNAEFDGVGEQYVPMNSTMPSLALEDYDLDGNLDIAGARSASGSIRVAYGTGQGMFHPMLLDFPTVFLNPSPLVSADFDGDGVPDLATAKDASPGEIGIMLGDGYGAFYDVVLFAAKPNASLLMVGDLNEDGATDLVLLSDGAAAGSFGLSVLLSNP